MSVANMILSLTEKVSDVLGKAVQDKDKARELATEVGTYNNYWRLADYLDVLNVLKEHSYFYFTSNKSSILELCDWLEKNLEALNPFRNATQKEMRVNVNHNAGYTDVMLYKNVSVSGELDVKYTSSVT